MYVCKYGRICACIFVHMYIHACVYVLVFVHGMHENIYGRNNIYIYIYIYIYI